MTVNMAPPPAAAATAGNAAAVEAVPVELVRLAADLADRLAQAGRPLAVPGTVVAQDPTGLLQLRTAYGEVMLRTAVAVIPDRVATLQLTPQGGTGGRGAASALLLVPQAALAEGTAAGSAAMPRAVAVSGAVPVTPAAAAQAGGALAGRGQPLASPPMPIAATAALAAELIAGQPLSAGSAPSAAADPAATAIRGAALGSGGASAAGRVAADALLSSGRLLAQLLGQAGAAMPDGGDAPGLFGAVPDDGPAVSTAGALRPGPPGPGAQGTTPGATGAASAVAAEGAAAEPGMPLPALREALALLAQARPEMARQLAARLPQPGSQLAVSLLSFMAGPSRGNAEARAPLGRGSPARAALEALGSKELAQRAADEVGASARPATDPAGGEAVRSWLIPVWHDGELSAVKVVVRRPRDEDDNPDAADRPNVRRFQIEVELSRLGPFQFDGAVHGRRFDLVVRSRDALPARMRAEIGAIFTNACSAIGLAGDLAFQIGSAQAGPTPAAPAQAGPATGALPA